MPTITIDPRYWQTVKKEYANWQFAWAREAFQNALDAGSTKINIVTRELDNGHVEVTFADNGCGMSKDTLLTRFLAIGGSFKTGVSTGGFGIAKNLLAFAQYSYAIHTGNIYLTGIGSEYEIDENHPSYHKGVTLIVTMDKNAGPYSTESIEDKITEWAAWSTSKCAIFLNNKKLSTLSLPKKPKAQLDWCDVYAVKNGSSNYKMRIRINGQFMFSMWSDFEKHIIVDIRTKNSQECLTANRDGMNWSYKDKLTKLVAQIFQDPKKLTETDSETIEFYRGSDGKLSLSQPKNKIAIGSAVKKNKSVNTPQTINSIKPGEFLPAPEINWRFEEIPLETIREGLDIVIVNAFNRDVSSKYLPGTMGIYATKLMRKWIELLRACAPLCGVSEDVIVGWTFTNDARAEYRYDSDHGHMFLLNPVDQRDNRLVQYWKNSVSGFYELVAAVVHELTHLNWPGHGESYANALTKNMGRVLANHRMLERIRAETK